MISIAHAQNNQGFTLPAPAGSANAPAPATDGAAGTTSTTSTPTVLKVEVNEGGNKGMLIGLGLVLVVMIAAFFLRGAWANSLVAKKVSPSAANASGWWLFILVTTVLGGGLYGAVNPTVIGLIYLGPLALFAVIALVMMIVMSGKK